jgi:adenylate kinase
MAAEIRYKTFLLFGAPGSGKGTQGSILGAVPGLVHVACGELFRDLRVGTPLGRVFLDYSSRGALVPDDFTVQLWHEYIENLVRQGRFDPDTDILILDGIPRNVAQARLMDQYVDVRRVYYLDCADRDKMFQRLKRRALHENRLDDASDTVIQNRLYVYEAETAPVLGHYPPALVRHVDTGRTPIEVLADILIDMRELAVESKTRAEVLE